jgi:hypothetical protein
MATATWKAHAAKSVTAGARDTSAPGSLEFFAYEHSGGDHRWEIAEQRLRGAP